MTTATPRLLLALALALLASCSPSPSETGSVQFAVSVRQDLAASISRVSVTSSAADIPSVTVDLAPTNGVWGGIIGNLPAGPNRSFLAQAFDASGTKLYEGSASGITIVANQITLVAITLQEVNTPPPFENEAPLIDSLVASSTTVTPGGSITLQASAHDPNPGDTLTYSWSSTAGSFSSSSAASTSWTAPHTLGAQRLTVTVTDSGGLSSSISLAINVARSGGEGDAQLVISFNSSPRVATVQASPAQLAVGQTTTVSVSASDPDGDSLAWSWSASCAGSWTNASSSSAQFTPSVLPAEACNNCRLTVSVSDGRGGQNTGTVALCVSNTPPINHFPPVIIRSYRSSDTASAGQVLTYEVVASDPEGSALTFSWGSSTGTLGTPTQGGNNSRITWTAPACVSSSPPATITATVTNAFNLTATRSFAVSGLPACATSGWAPTGFMGSPRLHHSATLLTNGKVLVAGAHTNLSSAELYDPASGTWSPAGSMLMARGRHTATLLTNGKVLVTGGDNNTGAVATTELYDPASDTWTSAGSMATIRYVHTATLLPNGKVLIAGGEYRAPTATAELYDPASGTWSSTGSMAWSRGLHRAILLPNGKALVVGGYSVINNAYQLQASTELYDPASGTWSPAASMSTPRQWHTVTLLPNGKVLVVGGTGYSGTLETAEVYDPATNTWSPTGSMNSARWGHSATLLPNGEVLVAGGELGGGGQLSSAELYNPVTGTWRPAPDLLEQRSEHPAILLPNGKVLVSGGFTFSAFLQTAELYTP